MELPVFFSPGLGEDLKLRGELLAQEAHGSRISFAPETSNASPINNMQFVRPLKGFSYLLLLRMFNVRITGARFFHTAAWLQCRESLHL